MVSEEDISIYKEKLKRIKQLMTDVKKTGLRMNLSDNKDLKLANAKVKEFAEMVLKHLEFDEEQRVKEPDINGQEPSNEEIAEHSFNTGLNWYNAREELRNKAYGGLPPEGYSSWGDYWKNY